MNDKNQYWTWNVWVHHMNNDDIIPYNVFNHRGFCQDLLKIKKKYGEDFDKFAEEIRTVIMYFFWAKCEWEVIISSWAGGDAKEKIDVYDQIMMNWDIFINYIWDHKRWITAKKLGLS